MKKQKKGIQLNEAVGAIVMLVLVAVLVIVAIVLFTNIGTTMMTTNTAATSVNESLGRATTSGITLYTGSTARDGICGSVTHIYNGTDGVPIALGNITQTGCTLVNTTSTTLYNSTVWLYSYPYSYTNDSSGSTAANLMVTNFSGYPALVGLVGTIIFLGIVIGVLVASFVFGRKENA